jgi:predicted transcriptional regulator YdeE
MSSAPGLIVLVLFAVAGCAAEGDSTRKQHQDGFSLVGFSVRTNNQQEASRDGLVGKQWKRLYQEGGLAKISHRTDSAVIALYTDYSSDEHGDYTYILGSRVSSCADAPEGMVCHHVPAADYLVLLSQRGALPGVVIALWQKVWNSTPQQLGGQRSYRNDYEVYDSRAADSAHAQIELYLGIK